MSSDAGEEANGNPATSPAPDIDDPLEDDIFGLNDQPSVSQDEEEEDGEDLFGANLEK